MADLTPEEAVDKLEVAFETALINGYAVLRTGIEPERLQLTNATAHAAATAIIRQNHTDRRLDIDLLEEDHRFYRLIRRQTERNR